MPEQQQVFTGFFSLVVLSSNALWAKVGKKCHIFLLHLDSLKQYFQIGFKYIVLHFAQFIFR